VKVFKIRPFARLARRAGIDDSALIQAALRAERGLIDATLGRFLIKQRVSRPHSGRSGGFRAVLFYRATDKAVFLYLFAKNQKANLTESELDTYRRLADILSAMSTADVTAALKTERWIEIGNEEQ
jgi:hypothetical protein